GMGKFPLIFSGVQLLHLALGEVLHHGLLAEGDPAVGRFIHAGNAVEGGGLAGAVGADESHDLSLIDLQGQVIHRHHAAKLHGDVFQLEDMCLAHFATSLVFLRGLSRSVISLLPMMPWRKNSTTIMMTTEKTTMRKPLRNSP